MTRLYGGRLVGNKTAFLENYKAEVEAALRAEGHDARELARLHKTIECDDIWGPKARTCFDVGVEELKRPGRSRARRAFDAVVLGVVAVPVLVGSLIEIVLAERARSRARDRHSARRKNAK